MQFVVTCPSTFEATQYMFWVYLESLDTCINSQDSIPYSSPSKQNNYFRRSQRHWPIILNWSVSTDLISYTWPNLPESTTSDIGIIEAFMGNKNPPNLVHTPKSHGKQQCSTPIFESNCRATTFITLFFTIILYD